MLPVQKYQKVLTFFIRPDLQSRVFLETTRLLFGTFTTSGTVPHWSR